MRLPERMARRAEGIAAIYQDDAAGREAGCVPDYPKGGQDSAGAGTGPRQAGTAGQRGRRSGEDLLRLGGLSPVRRRHEAVRRTERQGRLRRHTDACQRVLRRQRHGRGTYLCYAPAERGRRARGRGQGLRRGVQRQRRGNLRRHAETHGTGGARPHPALRHRPCQRRREGGGQGYGGGRVRRLVAAESAGIRDARRRGTPCQV